MEQKIKAVLGEQQFQIIQLAAAVEALQAEVKELKEKLSNVSER